MADLNTQNKFQKSDNEILFYFPVIIATSLGAGLLQLFNNNNASIQKWLFDHQYATRKTEIETSFALTGQWTKTITDGTLTTLIKKTFTIEKCNFKNLNRVAYTVDQDYPESFKDNADNVSTDPSTWTSLVDEINEHANTEFTEFISSPLANVTLTTSIALTSISNLAFYHVIKATL